MLNYPCTLQRAEVWIDGEMSSAAEAVFRGAIPVIFTLF